MTSTLVHQIEHWAKARPSAPALHGQRAGVWYTVTWAKYWETVQDVARGLIALGHEPGECVAIVGPNEPQWVLYQFGIAAARGIPAPMYPNNTPEQMGYIASNSRSKLGICANAELLEKFLQAERDGHMGKLERILTFDKVASDDERVMSFEELVELGRQQDAAELQARLSAITPDETCLLIYTSGTTGMPKGVMLDHGGQLACGRGIMSSFPQFERDVTYRAVSYLPLSHQAEQLVTNVSVLLTGGEIFFCPRLEDIKEYLLHAHPTVFLGVPRVWEKFQAALEAKLAESTGVRAKLADWARQTELGCARREFATGQALEPFTRRIAQKLVAQKIKGALGLDQLELAVTGAAPISVDTLEFFASIGICIHEAFGMTETSGVATMTHFRRPVFGAVGKAIPGVEIRIAQDGEIQLRGRPMTKGYLHMPEATEELYTEDGWLCTGDLGSLDDAGNLRITGRKKELLITAGGKNVAPVEMENHIKSIEGVGQVAVVGDRRPYLCALITLDGENLDKLARSAGTATGTLESMAADPKVRAFFEREIAVRCNEKVARYQTIKKFEILPGEWTPDGGELTPTMKLRRGPLVDKYSAQIEGMYDGAGVGPQATA